MAEAIQIVHVNPQPARTYFKVAKVLQEYMYVLVNGSQS